MQGLVVRKISVEASQALPAQWKQINRSRGLVPVGSFVMFFVLGNHLNPKGHLKVVLSKFKLHNNYRLKAGS